MNVTAAQFPQVYEDLGIDTGRLGCVMMDIEPIKVSHIIPEEGLYYADPEKHKWMQGVVSETVPHVTLLYGLLRSGKELRKHIDTVLFGWQPEEIKIDKVDFFYSNDPGESYITLIALVQVTPNLEEANARLGFLPHLNTFPTYKPHITLAYCKDNSDYHGYIEALNQELAGKKIAVTGLNYGD
jgi:2'-5' RNA ligase